CKKASAAPALPLPEGEGNDQEKRKYSLMDRKSVGYQVHFWFWIFVAAGLILFTVVFGLALPLDDMGLHNRLTERVFDAFLWPDTLARSLGWFPEGPPTHPTNHVEGFLVTQLLGWG